MKKIGIITIVHGENYGNRLQNYALQNTLLDMGYKVETIRRNVYRSLLSQIKHTIYKYLKWNKQKKRKKLFKEFNAKYIYFSKTILYNRQTKQVRGIADYNAFVCGSDQIWNPNWSTNSDIDFLTFAPIEKRIAYAASFGVEEIPEKDIERYKKNLGELSHISVREESGVKIIKDLTGIHVETVLDPTMLVSSEQWKKIENRPTQHNDQKYILCYFLAGISLEVKSRIKEYATAKSVKTIWIDNPEYQESYEYGPCEFLYLIHNAEHIFTDSFHCTVFSIIFQRQFDVFSRYMAGSKMNDRIVTLLCNCGIEKRYDRKMIDDKEIDYFAIKRNIGQLVQVSLDYLKNSIDSVRKNDLSMERIGNDEK